MMHNIIEWSPGSKANFDLGQNEIHIWKINFTEAPIFFSKQAATLLSLDEKEKIDRLKFEEKRRNSLYSRASLRLILSKYLGVSPKGITFNYNAHNKPFIIQEDVFPLHFNLSHSQDLAILAVSRGSNLGIDIEFFRQRNEMKKLALRFFSPQEYETLLNLPDNLFLEGFYRTWTSREAIIKALGIGLFFESSGLSVCADPRKPPSLLKIENDITFELMSFTPDIDYRAALATEKTFNDLNFFEYDFKL